MRFMIRVGCVVLAAIALLSAAAWYLSAFHGKSKRWVWEFQFNEVALLSVFDGNAYLGVRSGATWATSDPFSQTEPYGTMFRFR